jgi:hypothetical protein
MLARENCKESGVGLHGGLPRRSPDVMSRQAAGELVLFHLKTDRFYSLNPSAARLWELLGAGVDRAALEEQMRREFEVEGAQLSREIDAMLASMTTEGLLSF